MNQTKKEVVINYVMDHIKSNELQPGDKLPTQAEMVNQLHISRTTIRETIKELEGKKIIRVVNGSGMFVADPKENHLLSGIELKKKQNSLIDVLESRWAIETAVINNIIKYVTNEELEPIQKIVDTLIEHFNLGKRQNDIDKQFHYALYNCCRNQVLRELIISLGYLTDELWDFPLGISNPFLDTVPLHKKLFEAIVSRDDFRAKHYNDMIFIMMIDEIKNHHIKNGG